MREGGRLIIIDRLVLSHYIIVHTCVMVHGIMVNGHVTMHIAHGEWTCDMSHGEWTCHHVTCDMELGLGVGTWKAETEKKSADIWSLWKGFLKKKIIKKEKK
eukprot:c19738_g1_i2 orf=95-400(-)